MRNRVARLESGFEGFVRRTVGKWDERFARLKQNIFGLNSSAADLAVMVRCLGDPDRRIGDGDRVMHGIAA